jgi:hypothetical protein
MIQFRPVTVPYMRCRRALAPVTSYNDGHWPRYNSHWPITRETMPGFPLSQRSPSHEVDTFGSHHRIYM